MKNWSGHLEWHPNKIFQPESEAAICALVVAASREGRKVRMIGTGHSFTPLFVTEDYLVSLDNYQGLIEVNAAKRTARVKAGTKIHALNLLLDAHGLALENMGDIDVQSIAGAISTGTHGTGIDLGTISTQVCALRFVDGLGQIRECSREVEPDLFRAASLSLGTLGIITEVTLRCEPSYNLSIQIRKRKMSELAVEYAELNRNNRHFEFYWFPNTDIALTKELCITDEEPQERPFGDYLQEQVLENYAFKALNEIALYWPSKTRAISKFTANTVSDFRRVRRSYEVFSTSRTVRFNEMEYNVPIEAYDEVSREVRRWINKHNQHILFPLEHRFVKGDDLMLSPATGRDSAYIAAHTYHKKDYKAYFQVLEDIFRAHGGRPHWGKIHTLTSDGVRAAYPELETFARIREECDPKGLFLSPYLKTLLPSSSSSSSSSTVNAAT